MSAEKGIPTSQKLQALKEFTTITSFIKVWSRIKEDSKFSAVKDKKYSNTNTNFCFHHIILWGRHNALIIEVCSSLVAIARDLLLCYIATISIPIVPIEIQFFWIIRTEMLTKKRCSRGCLLVKILVCINKLREKSLSVEKYIFETKKRFFFFLQK